MDKKSRELVMAKLYFKNKDYKMAEKSFNEYLSMNPEDISALKLLAQVYEQNKRFDKAFEMYERCYLAEPDRTGVLLDISRILLMNEVCLDYVDYRKWLNLAIQAFPSNPITVHCKAFLSTLPTSPQREVVSRVESKAPAEDPLLKILERMERKIDSIEKRLETIDTKLRSVDTSSPQKESQSSNVSNVFGSGNLFENSFKKLNIDVAPAQEPPKPTFEFAGFGGGNLFEQGLKKFNIQNNMPSFSKPEETIKNKEVVQNEKPLIENTCDNSFGKFNIGVVPNQEPPKSTFEFSGFGGGNLFEQSIKKFNIQNNMSSFSKPEENVENEEVVPNEELPIENTCDMTPIEIKTGEEEEDLLFEQRCKLFRFRDKEYKERGLGSIKVLKHKTTGKGRLIMRREAVGLVCLNCWDCSKVVRVRENQVRWMGIDASDGEPEAIVSLVKFKTSELTDTFMEHLTALFPENSSANNSSVNNSSPTKTDNSEKKSTAEVELVEPKLDPQLVDKARQLQLPDLFYHKLINQEPCTGCQGCENEQ